MKPEPPERRRRTPSVRLRRSSQAGICSSVTCLFSGEMLRGYFSEIRSLRRLRTAALFVVVFGFLYIAFSRAFDPDRILFPEYFVPSTHIFPSLLSDSLLDSGDTNLETVLKEASMEDNTVILTTLNEAWADPENSILDLFLESFRIGYKTSRLLNHLVIIALDQKAFMSCKRVHTHCFALVTEGYDLSQEAYFMTPDYLKMMWLRIDFLRSVLELGYNFLFTGPISQFSFNHRDKARSSAYHRDQIRNFFKDADVMWFRDPFPHFYPNTDFQIACDHYSGNSTDIKSNHPNGGFSFVRSNNRSIQFYKFWYSSRELYPGLHDQDVLNNIKNDSFLFDIKLQIKFLSTSFFGGFCEPSRDLNKVCTMHANCCVGLGNKVHDLRNLLQDWKNFMALPPRLKMSPTPSWRPPNNCT